MALIEQANAVLQRGAQDSLIESFGIRGLYGYRSIELSSDYAATILIAKNGTGKTTLLGALDAFLRMQLSRLRNLEFANIHCKLRGVDDELVLTHNDVIEFLQVPSDGELVRLASRSNTDPSLLFSFLIDEWPIRDADRVSVMENKPFSAVVSAFNYNYREASAACDKVRQHLLARQVNVARISTVLSEKLDEYDIVYLPTYRRVELALRGDPRESPQRRRRPKFDLAAGSLFTGDIQFGLSDISERLSEMNQQIVMESNNGYRRISANIINELLDGTFDSADELSPDVPSAEELKLFFDRIERGRRNGPYLPVNIPNLDKVYTGEGLPASSSKFLNYFLTKLFTVIRSTKDVELPVDGFIDSCNKYLLSAEPSTVLQDEDTRSKQRNVDGKVLRVNRANLRVHVESVPEGRKISLDALSSGEKQMISLFAKLYLYPGKKIVLIDEPELSLSIDWQRKILVDVLSAPLCTQLVAITHSPFVFDNELDPFARALKLGRDPFPALEMEEVDTDD